MAKAKSSKKATQEHEARVREMTRRLKEELRPAYKWEFDKFLDSFGNDVIGDLVAQWGGWNSPQTFSQVRSILDLMIEAWQAGRAKLQEEIEEL